MTDADLISLLRDTLTLAKVRGRVEAGDGDVRIVTDAGDSLAIRRGVAPTRWFIATARRTRPVPGVAALLEAVRVAFVGTMAPAARVGGGARFGTDATPETLRCETDGMHDAGRRVPVALVTGFLGSGKTTLISRLLRRPALRRTAVIVNEFGEIGLDHELIEHGDETMLRLVNGCLCCATQSSIAHTLSDLQQRRSSGDIAFDNVVIETSGLADPAPILHSMMTDIGLADTYAVGSVLTVIDSQRGEATLQVHPEARRQVEFADLLLCSKTDIGPAHEKLTLRLRQLNPDAPVIAALDDVATLFLPHSARAVVDDIAQHTPRVGSISIVRDMPVPASALALFLQSLAKLAGERLLRLKGIVELSERPGQRLALHGIQNIYSTPEPMAGAAEGRPRTQIVIIAQDMPRYFPIRLLDALIEEVTDEAERSHMTVVSVPSCAAPSNAGPDIGRP